MNSQQVTIVLVRPQYPFNIGATARAMHNMGFTRLVLVTPGCEIDVQAREGAANAQEILARRETYTSLEEFYQREGEGLRIAFTRRDGIRRTVEPFQDFVRGDLISKLKNTWSTIPIYLLFGSESDGLSTSELEWANRLCSLPTFGPNGSYNLAQAVLLTLFILQENTFAAASIPEIKHEPFQYPHEVVEKWLETVGFNLDGFQKKNAATVLHSLFLRAVPDKDELRIFTSVLHQNIRKLKDRNSGKI